MRRLPLRGQSGFTIVEVLVASTVLIFGVLGSFVLVNMSNASLNRAKAREGATNLAREMLEDSREVNFTTIGQSGWADSIMTGLSGRTTAVTAANAYTSQTTVARRGVTYAVSTSWCSVDDSKDSYGAHAASTTWCSDSAATGTTDPQPEDLKRVTVNLTWTERGRTASVQQVATFGAGGGAVGPVLSNLQILTPAVSDPSAPLITTNPASGTATFKATSGGAADMKFSVNGTEQLTGVVNNNNGSWTYTWPITSLKDGTYQISAVAVDALGVRGQSRTLPVTLSRGAPTQPTNIVGGYNYVYINGVKTLVVEGQWDASPEGSVTGYEVLRNSTSVCGGVNDLSLSCIDPNAPQSGSSTYTFRTWYRDAAGTAKYIYTPYFLTAPTPSTLIPTVYGLTNSTNNSGTSCTTSTAFQQDASSNYPTSGGTASVTQAVAGCLPKFTTTASLAAGTVTFATWFTNTGTKSCSFGPVVVLNNTTTIATGGTQTIPAGNTTPIKVTVTGSASTRNFAVGDQLNWWQSVPATSACAGVHVYYNSGAYQSTISMPTLSGGSAGNPLAQPSAPTGLTGSAQSDGTTKLTWTAPASSTPAVDFYRIYRDGTDYTNRIDTTDATSTTLGAASSANATTITVPNTSGFAAGQSLSVDTGTNQDNATVSSVGTNSITFTSGLAHAHAVGIPVALRTVTWTDNKTGGSTHTYLVTSVSSALAESVFTSPLGPL
jgi:Tfp pilus assembly protein PilV